MGLTLPAWAASANTTWPSALVMGTGRPGGDYAIYGPAWGRAAETDAGLGIAYRSSGGASANILLIEENTAQLGLTTVSVAAEARMGSGSWTGGVCFTGFRALFPTFPSVLQIISPRQTGISTLAALAGQTVGIGPNGGSGVATVPAIFASVGVIPGKIVAGDYIELTRAMLNGQIGACAFLGAPPLPVIKEAAHGWRLSLIGFSEAEAAQVARTLPGMSAALMPAGTFPGQSTTVSSVGTGNLAIGAATLPDSLAKALTVAALRNQKALMAAVPAAATIPAVSVSGDLGIPFHPGAADALRESGIYVPDRYVQS